MTRPDLSDAILVLGLLLLGGGLALVEPWLALVVVGGLLTLAAGVPILRRL